LAVSSHAESARSLVYQAYDTPDNAEAIRLFNQALEENADFIYAYVGRGLRKQQQGDLNGAIEDFGKAIDKNPLFRDAYIWRAKAKQQKGDDAGYNADMAAAEQAAQKGDYALEELDKSVEKDPQDAQAYLDRARYKKHKGQLEGAIEDYNQYLLRVGRPKNHLVIFERANAKKAAGDVEGALNDYSTAIRMFPDNAAAYEKRAALRRQVGDIQGADADTEDLHAIQHAQKMKQIEKLSRAIENAEGPSYLQLQRSELWMEVGNSTNALRDARQVLNVSPNDPRAKRLEKKALRSVKEHRQPKKDQ
jgi:tetratricopeptide (TPR) repeat protein